MQIITKLYDAKLQVIIKVIYPGVSYPDNLLPQRGHFARKIPRSHICDPNFWEFRCQPPDSELSYTVSRRKVSCMKLLGRQYRIYGPAAGFDPGNLRVGI